MRPGERGTIMSIITPSPTRERLMEMGVLPGVEVEFLSFAPLGDPIRVRLFGYTLSLRKEEADGVLVKPFGGFRRRKRWLRRK